MHPVNPSEHVWRLAHNTPYIYIMMPRHLLGVPFWPPLLWLLPWIFRLLWPEACELMVPWKPQRTAAFPLDGRSRDTWEVEYSSIALNLGDGNYEPLNAIEDLWTLHQTIHANIQLSATDKALLDVCAELPRKRPLNQRPPKTLPNKLAFSTIVLWFVFDKELVHPFGIHRGFWQLLCQFVIKVLHLLQLVGDSSNQPRWRDPVLW